MEYSKEIKDKQIGCGYCAHEKKCPMRNPKINKAKMGCKEFIHHQNIKK
jgi:hypothetical protein